MTKIKLFASLFLMLFAVSALSQWTFVGGVTGAGAYPSLSVYDTNKVVVFGGPTGVAFVSRSTNGGVTFVPMGTAGMTLELYCGWAYNDNILFAGDGGAAGGAGGNAHVYMTTNGGVSWTVALSTGGSAGFINGIVFSKLTPTFGVAQSDPPTGAGQPYWVAITSNGGMNWTVQNPPGVSGMASAQNSIVCIDNQWYGFGGNSSPLRVVFTSNGGTSWNTSSLGITGNFASGFTMNSNKLEGLAASSTSLPNIARTINGATSWSTVATGSGGTNYCTMKWIHGTTIAYLTTQTGTTNAIKRSSDGGLTWTGMTTMGLGGFVHLEYYKATNNAIYLYAISGDGTVMKYVDWTLVGINPNNKTIPTEYKLEQNYPNPFNPSTTINYSVPFSSNVSIRVFDMAGHEVASVVNRHHEAGNYTEQFNASSLSSGVYFYTLSVDGQTVDSKKMMLVK